ncbi:MAG: hypothetical protein LBH09_07975, partial [Peptococcaceae bacterium]|nr:hypothetical protein [Peptococcaceae bacterium]
MGGDIQIDESTEKAYGFVEENYRETWGEDTWSQFDYCYKNNKMNAMMNAMSNDANYNTEQRLMQERQIYDLQ